MPTRNSDKPESREYKEARRLVNTSKRTQGIKWLFDLWMKDRTHAVMNVNHAWDAFEAGFIQGGKIAGFVDERLSPVAKPTPPDKEDFLPGEEVYLSALRDLGISHFFSCWQALALWGKYPVTGLLDFRDAHGKWTHRTDAGGKVDGYWYAADSKEIPNGRVKRDPVVGTKEFVVMRDGNSVLGVRDGRIVYPFHSRRVSDRGPMLEACRKALRLLGPEKQLDFLESGFKALAGVSQPALTEPERLALLDIRHTLEIRKDKNYHPGRLADVAVVSCLDEALALCHNLENKGLIVVSTRSLDIPLYRLAK